MSQIVPEYTPFVPVWDTQPEPVLDFTALLPRYPTKDPEKYFTDEEKALLEAKMQKIRDELAALAEGLVGTQEGQEELDSIVTQAATNAWSNAANITEAVLRLDDLRDQAITIIQEAEDVSGLATEASQKATEAFNKAVAAEEASIAAITNSVTEYASSTSETATPTSGWSETPPARAPGSYIWFRTSLTYGNGSTTSTTPALLTGNDGAPGTSGADGVGITSTAVTYHVSASGTTPPTGAGTPTVPTVPEGQFLWTRTITNYTNSTSTTAYSVSRAGTNGSNGSPGTPGSNGQTSYLHVAYATNATGTTGFSTTDPTGKTYMGTLTDFLVADSTNPALYDWVLIKGADGSNGGTGATGKGISSSVVTYQNHTSGSGTAPTGTWLTTVPTTPEGQFLWTRTILTFSDNATTTTYSVAKQGVTGSTGATGVSVTSIVPYFRRSVGTPDGPPSGWTTTEPAAVSGSFLWRSDQVTYSNSTVVYTPVTKVASDAFAQEAWDKAKEANNNAISRGTDLVTNGTGYLKNNTNFTPLTFDMVDTPNGTTGSFNSLLGVQQSPTTNEFTPVDTSKNYLISAQAKQKGTSVLGRFYIRVNFYTSWGGLISKLQVDVNNGSLSTLTSPLSPGDSTVYVDNTTNWQLPTASIYSRYIGVWDYVDPNGKRWPPLSFTDNRIGATGAYSALTPTTVTLAAPYTGAPLPAGTQISNMLGGDTKVFSVASNQLAPPEWTTFTKVMSSADMPAGASTIKVSFLLNYGDATDSQVSVAGVSVSDASAAADAASKAIKASVNEYAVNTSETVAPTTGWSINTPTRTPGSFIWFRTKITRGDNTTATTNPALLTGNAGATGNTGATGNGITSTDVHYSISSTGVLPAPVGGWQTTVPTVGAGQFLWTRTTINYNTGSPTVTYAVARTGTNGNNGSPGAPGSDGQTSYLHVAYATNSTGSSGFSTTDPSGKTYMGTYTDFLVGDSPDATKYDWVLIKGADGSNGETGSTGPTGVGIDASQSSVMYQNSASGTAAPTGTWLTLAALPLTPEGQYMWTRTIIKFTDGASTTSYTAAKQGVKGNTGNTGAVGVSVTSIEPHFKQHPSSSGTPSTPVPPSGAGWTTDPPAYEAEMSLWRSEKITYSNGNIAFTTPVKDAAYDVAKTAVVSANGKNSRYTSTSPPGTTTVNPTTGLPFVVSDTWWQVDSLEARNSIGQWSYMGAGTWKGEFIKSEVIANLDTNKLTAGAAIMDFAVAKKLVSDFSYHKVLTAGSIAVISTDGGMYPDPMFLDAGLSADRATNNSLTYNSTTQSFSGNPGNLWLTARGEDESKTMPLVAGELYTIRVWGTNLTAASGRGFALKWGSSYVLVSGTTYFAGGMSIVLRLTAAQTDARVQIYKSGGTSNVATITRVEFRQGIGGTLIEPDSITTDKIRADALTYWEATGMKLTSGSITGALIQTEATTNRGVKIDSSGLRAYDSTGRQTLRLDSSGGAIKGIDLEGVNIRAGSSFVVSDAEGFVSVRSAGIILGVPYASSGSTITQDSEGLKINTESSRGDVWIGSSDGGASRNKIYICDRDMFYTAFGRAGTVTFNAPVTPAGNTVFDMTLTFPSGLFSSATSLPCISGSFRSTSLWVSRWAYRVQTLSYTSATLRITNVGANESPAISGVKFDWSALTSLTG